jgi:uncharacterized RDD family membrane protein YckC
MSQSLQSFGVRAFSRTVDLVFLGVCIVFGLYVAHKASIEFYPMNEFLVWLIVLLSEVVVPLTTGGATLGRMVAGLALVGENGLRPTAWQHVARVATRIGLFAIFVVLVSYESELLAVLFVVVIEGCFCTFQKRRQTLSDLASRTVVIRRGAKLLTG